MDLVPHSRECGKPALWRTELPVRARTQLFTYGLLAKSIDRLANWYFCRKSLHDNRFDIRKNHYLAKLRQQRGGWPGGFRSRKRQSVGQPRAHLTCAISSLASHTRGYRAKRCRSLPNGAARCQWMTLSSQRA